MDPKLKQTSEGALQTKQILETLGFSAMEFGNELPQAQSQCRYVPDNKRVEQWKSNLTAPSLGVFRVEEGPIDSPFGPSEMTNNVNHVSIATQDKPMVPTSVKWPSVTDLKLKLLSENAKIMDKFLSSKKKVNQFRDNAAASAEPVLATKESEIQEWVRSQRLYNKEQKKRESIRNVFDRDVDPSSMIYVASVAAAAATSAGLTIQHQQQDGHLLPRKSSNVRTSKEKKKMSLKNRGREDSGLGASAVSVPSTPVSDSASSDWNGKNEKRGMSTRFIKVLTCLIYKCRTTNASIYC